MVHEEKVKTYLPSRLIFAAFVIDYLFSDTLYIFRRVF